MSVIVPARGVGVEACVHVFVMCVCRNILLCSKFHKQRRCEYFCLQKCSSHDNARDQLVVPDVNVTKRLCRCSQLNGATNVRRTVRAQTLRERIRCLDGRHRTLPVIPKSMTWQCPIFAIRHSRNNWMAVSMVYHHKREAIPEKHIGMRGTGIKLCVMCTLRTTERC